MHNPYCNLQTKAERTEVEWFTDRSHNITRLSTLHKLEDRMKWNAIQNPAGDYLQHIHKLKFYIKLQSICNTQRSKSKHLTVWLQDWLQCRGTLQCTTCNQTDREATQWQTLNQVPRSSPTKHNWKGSLSNQRCWTHVGEVANSCLISCWHKARCIINLNSWGIKFKASWNKERRIPSQQWACEYFLKLNFLFNRDI